MDHPTNAVFEKIERAAEAAIRSAEVLPDSELRALGAVNWGDIGTSEVVFCRNKLGETWFVVEIEEASPGCGLADFVGYALAKAFPGERSRSEPSGNRPPLPVSCALTLLTGNGGL